MTRLSIKHRSCRSRSTPRKEKLHRGSKSATKLRNRLSDCRCDCARMCHLSCTKSLTLTMQGELTCNLQDTVS